MLRMLKFWFSLLCLIFNIYLVLQFTTFTCHILTYHAVDTKLTVSGCLLTYKEELLLFCRSWLPPRVLHAFEASCLAAVASYNMASYTSVYRRPCIYPFCVLRSGINMSSSMWNSRSLNRPTVTFCRYDSSEISRLGNLKTIADLLNTITATIKENNVLNIELALLNRMIYRLSMPFKNDKQLKSLQKVKKCLVRFIELHVEFISEQLYLEMKSSFQLDFSRQSVSLPSRQMFEFILVRIQGMSRLLLQILQYCQESFHYCLQKVYLGHFLNVNTILLSLISRIWTAVRLLLVSSIEWYQTLYVFTANLKGTSAVWLTAENKLPDNLALWLGPTSEQYLIQLSPSAKDSEHKITS